MVSTFSILFSIIHVFQDAGARKSPQGFESKLLKQFVFALE